MSTINSKNVQVGTSGSATDNFTLYQPTSPDGTVRLGVGNSGATTLDAVTVTSAGNMTVAGSISATSFSSTSSPIPVSSGGTGVASTTAYAVLCGGTTSTAALQSVSGVGTTGQVLTSNGAGALPTFQSVGGGFAAGTRMAFAQAAAPTGWTQDTSSNADNRMLRVVNTTGGGVGGTASPILNNVVPSHTHGFTTGNQSADHNHGISDPTHRHNITVHWTAASAPGQLSGRETSPQSSQFSQYASTGITTGNQSTNHSHSGTTDNGSSQTNWTPKYIDMIICSKD